MFNPFLLTPNMNPVASKSQPMSIKTQMINQIDSDLKKIRKKRNRENLVKKIDNLEIKQIVRDARKEHIANVIIDSEDEMGEEMDIDYELIE